MAYKQAVPVLAAVLSRRGFDTTQMANLGPYEIDAMVNSQALRFVLRHAEDSRRCHIYFDTEPRALSETQLRKFLESYEGQWNPELDTLIVVSVEPPQPKAWDLAHWLEPGFLQLFCLQDLVSDRTQSEFMPPHRPMTDLEIANNPATRDVEDLPDLQWDDAAAKWYGIRPGQVVEITRTSQLTGESLYYRRCVR